MAPVRVSGGSERKSGYKCKACVDPNRANMWKWMRHCAYQKNCNSVSRFLGSMDGRWVSDLVKHTVAEIRYNIYDRILYFNPKYISKVCENEPLDGIVG